MKECKCKKLDELKMELLDQDITIANLEEELAKKDAFIDELINNQKEMIAMHSEQRECHEALTESYEEYIVALEGTVEDYGVDVDEALDKLSADACFEVTSDMMDKHLRVLKIMRENREK